MKWFHKTILSSDFWLGRSTRKDWKYDPNVTVTIVIPAHNEEEFIRIPIESALCQTHPTEIIVVDDHSSDGTGDTVKEYPSVKLLRTPSNKGSKAQALNYAIPHVNTEIFICLDADTELDQFAVENMLRAFSDDEIMVASGLVVSKGHENIWQNGRYGEYILGQSIMKSAQFNMGMVLVASGCFFGIRTEYLKQHGFSNRTMAEDMDLTWTSVEDGYEVAFVRDAYCFVSDPPNWKVYRAQVMRWYRGFFQCILARKFWIKSIRLMLPVYLYMMVNMLGLPLMLLAMISYPLYSLMVIGISLTIFLIYTILFHLKLRTGEGFGSLKHVLSMWFISIVNYPLYILSFWKEIVMKERLDNWIKGH